MADERRCALLVRCLEPCVLFGGEDLARIPGQVSHAIARCCKPIENPRNGGAMLPGETRSK
jgi:hypothetical protein